MEREFALYKGEKLLSVGTIDEIAEELNIKPQTVKFYGINAYKQRVEKRKKSKNTRILVELLDDEESW